MALLPHSHVLRVTKTFAKAKSGTITGQVVARLVPPGKT